MLPLVKHLKHLKNEFRHITKLGKPQRETNHCMLFLAEYRVIFEKIDNN